MTGNRMRDVLLLSIAVALGLFVLAVTCPIPPMVGGLAAAGLGAGAALWVAALAVLSDGLVMAEVVTLTAQSRKRGLIVVVA